MAALTLLYVLCGSEAEADGIAAHLLDEHLIACANRGAPVVSHYDWDGVRQSGAEWPLLMKTCTDRVEAAVARIHALHSYTVPAILHWPVEATPEYAAWATGAVTP